MKISVLIPTHRRADSLQRSLEGVRAQIRPADEVLVVIQSDDDESRSLLETCSNWKALKTVSTPFGGQVNQLNCGLDAATGDVIAITDDDAVPHPDWLSRIESQFIANQDLGGVGGRDLVREHGVLLEGNPRLVGKVQWFGRIAGNHHICNQMFPNVDTLKGANMAYRASAIAGVRFDSDLRGRGAQTCNDMAFSLAVQKQGWRLLFDPDIAVDHFPAVRPDGEKRGALSLQALEESSFNYYLAIRRHMRSGMRRRMALSWASLIGTRTVPGLLRGLASRVRNDKNGIEVRSAARRAWISARKAAAGKL